MTKSQPYVDPAHIALEQPEYAQGGVVDRQMPFVFDIWPMFLLTGQCHEFFTANFFFIKRTPLDP
jgi:hypothetical protein